MAQCNGGATLSKKTSVWLQELVYMEVVTATLTCLDCPGPRRQCGRNFRKAGDIFRRGARRNAHRAGHSPGSSACPHLKLVMSVRPIPAGRRQPALASRESRCSGKTGKNRRRHLQTIRASCTHSLAKELCNSLSMVRRRAGRLLLLSEVPGKDSDGQNGRKSRNFGWL